MVQDGNLSSTDIIQEHGKKNANRKETISKQAAAQ
jgi:hypothetical protein